MKFEIKYALSGGFGGCDNQEWEEIEAEDTEEALLVAWSSACEEYDSMAGMNGIRDPLLVLDRESQIGHIPFIRG